MLDSLYIAASGMSAQQLNVDTIANNLANVNTTGFKRGRVSFEDLMYRQIAPAQPLLLPLAPSAAGAGGLGSGVAVTAAGQLFTAGDLKKTDLPYDLAVRGDGFFQVTLTDGSRAYTRSGSFQLDRDGMLATADGHLLEPAIQVPTDATAVTIDAAGKVLATVAGESQPVEAGTIELATFMNPSGLRPQGGNLYLPTEASGDPIVGRPGERALGSIAQGYLEASNVRLVDEFVNLVIAQRAYEASSKAVQASDEMLGIVNNLRR